VRFFRDLSLRWKLVAMAGLLCTLLVVSGVVAVINVSSSARHGRRLYHGATVPIGQLETVEVDLGNVDSDLLKGIAQPRYAQVFHRDSSQLEQDLSAYRRIPPTPAERALLDRFQSTWSQFQAAGDSVLTLAQKGTVDGARAASGVYFAKAEPLDRVLDQTVGSLVKIKDAQAAADSQSISSNEDSSTMLTIAILIASVLAGGGLALVISRQIHRSVLAILARLEMLKTKGADRLQTGSDGWPRVT